MSASLLVHAPTASELERLYHELAAIGAPSVGRRAPWPYRPRSAEQLVALATDMLRYDARLLGILVQLLVERWRGLHPTRLREELARCRWPQALLVALEFVRLASDDVELRHWCDYVSAGWLRVEPAERFFLDAERPGSRTHARKLGRNLAPYARWGFIATERPSADAFRKRPLGRYDARTRRDILADLVAAPRSVGLSLAEYLDAVDGSISRQQALLDLRAAGLRPSGTGPGARWVVPSRRRARGSDGR
ncbi:MAG: hypothetical protein IT379_21790 [Deltaproteobacteria bacterium]|nr:hypothetical protein [Deltaproteobacteria bacterium]